MTRTKATGLGRVMFETRMDGSYDTWSNGKRQLSGTGFAVSFVAGIILLLVLVGVGINWGMSISCRNTADVMGLPHRYSMSTGCLVQYEGRWMAPEQLRFTQPVEEAP